MGLDAKIVHILHDEIIVEAKDEDAKEVSDLVKYCMETALEKLIPGVPFEVKPEIRETWGIIDMNMEIPS